MKSIAFLTLLAVGGSHAGEPVLYDKNPVMPPPAPSLYSWFAGATAGYLIDNEEGMYTLHLGVDLPNQLGGWDQAIYLEVGYAELSDCVELDRQYYDYDLTNGLGGGGGGDNGPGTPNNYLKVCADLEIIPVTLNYKLERMVGNNFNWYIGAGAGVAFIDASVKASDGVSSESFSDDDTVFYAQAFTGILYNVNPSFEIYAGLRYVYFDEPSFSDGGFSASWSDLEDLGFDFHNDDVLVEAGARVNF